MIKYILLDLNHTLAEKISMNPLNFTYDVSKDIYSKELVRRINMAYPHKKVYIVTARTDNYKEATIQRIETELDIEIAHYEFKKYTDRFVPVQDFKARFVKQLMEQENILPSEFVALESNQLTREKYKILGIRDIFTRQQFLK